jgi:uncharacterized protein YecT (DUF1311 family)
MDERHPLRGCGLAVLLAVSACDRGEPTAAEDSGRAGFAAAPAAGWPANGGRPISGAPPLTLPRSSQAAPSSLATSGVTGEQVMAERSLTLEPCLSTGQAADGVSAAMFRCLRAELDFQNSRLNAAYEAAIATRDAAGQADLRAQERDWIRLRDEKCSGEATGGTIDMVGVPNCLIDETIRRRLALEAGQG